MTIISVSNQKGGPGKTTTSIQLVYRIAEHKKRVLVIDLDPQGNLTNYFLDRAKTNPDIVKEGSARLFLANGDFEILPADLTTIGEREFYHDQIDVLPAHTHSLERLDRVDVFESVGHIVKRLPQLKALNYDAIVIDTGPQIGVRQIGALLLSDHLITPIEVDCFSTEGLVKIAQMKEAAQHQRKQIGFTDKSPHFHVYANKISKQSITVRRDLINYRKFLGSAFLNSSMPHSQVVKDAITIKRPVFKLAPNGNAASVGRQFAVVLDELLQRCNVISGEM
ncbi:TPA: ParA family protein [Vibrio vulnificus]|nr:ParA family protein [Vibrio vulnificus]